MRRLAILLVVAASCVATPCMAWWFTGHMVVARIAYDRLNPHAKAEVDRLLAMDALPESRTFVEASAWADDLKSMGIHAYDEWHYLDLPFSPDSTPLPAVSKLANVEWAIDQCVRTLKSSRAPDGEKARMLRFLIHFVGDAHQPLHCTSRVTQAHKQGDRGGNDYLITAGRARNLHAYWDSGAGLFEDVKRPMDAGAEMTIANLAMQATTANPSSGYPTLGEPSYHKWIEEGFGTAQTLAYTTPEGEAPTAEYEQKVKAAALRQVALAGYRLSNLLNSIYPANSQ